MSERSFNMSWESLIQWKFCEVIVNKSLFYVLKFRVEDCFGREYEFVYIYIYIYIYIVQFDGDSISVKSS